LHRGLRASCETFAEKPNDAPSSLSVIKKEASALLVGDCESNRWRAKAAESGRVKSWEIIAM
jgi:hypothetical protein